MLGGWRKSPGKIVLKINSTYSQGEKRISYIKRRNVNCIGQVFCWYCFLKHIIEGKIERRERVMGRRGKRLRQLTGNLKE